MKIESIKVRGFKRFADLEVSGIPREARLVVLVGPNGSGKSSLFEALNYWFSQVRGSINFAPDYHVKAGTDAITDWGQLMNRINVQFHGVTEDPRHHPERNRKLFYFRSAYRHEADFRVDHLSRVGDVLEDQRRPQLMISSEARVSDNYHRIVGLSIEALFDPAHKETTAGEITDRLVGRIREAMRRVFPDLVLLSLGKPMENGTFYFDKGASRHYHYKNLSGGEKAAFDLLLDFVVKCEFFDDTVFCIDEPELHMHTGLQAIVLEELLRHLPADSQLWIATHSIGMARRAMRLHKTSPSEIVFLDFGDRDFDNPQVMTPVTVDRKFWKRVFSVTMDDLADLVAPSEIVFCEGSKGLGTGERNPSFDATVYGTVFASSHPDTEFVPLGGTTEVETNAVLIGNVVGKLVDAARMWSVFDRDDRSDVEIEELQSKGIRVLRRRDLENYLWDDEVLAKLCSVNGHPTLATQVISKKQDLLNQAQANGISSDDVKRISGQLYNEVKRVLNLAGCGSNATAFARDTLALLLTPDTSVYRELEEDIFGS